MVQTSSTLLIACREIAYGSFNTLTTNGPIRISNMFGGEDFIHVVAFNCNDKNEFVGYFSQLVEELEDTLITTKEEKIKLNVEHSIKFLNEIVKTINSGQYEHEIPKQLLEIVAKELRTYNIQKNQMLYLSGVSCVY